MRWAGTLLLLCAVVSALPAPAAAEQASEPISLAAGQLDAGANDTCGMLPGGNVRCWGFSGNGQLGYGNTDSIGDDETPASVGPVSLGGHAVKAVAAGDFHTCALLDDGSVRCWGFGAQGRLGYVNTNSVTDPNTVGPVNLGGAVKAITAGGAHSCALLVDGTVRCWGFAGAGELGYGDILDVGDNETPGSVGPVKLGPGRTAVAISAGGLHTCVVLDTGSVRCWGEGASGQLGYGNKNRIGDNETPVGGHPLNGVACPSASQCTAVDDSGGQVTFNPTSPGSPETIAVDLGQALTAVACPSVSQCTALEANGQQVTFNPTAPGASIPTTIDAGNTLTGLACPSVSQCTAVDNVGQQVTFNPTAPGTPIPTTIDAGHSLFDVACPSASQCTAVDNGGRQVTFNPTSPGSPIATIISGGLTRVACPSVSQCTAVDNVGQQVTFNPTSPGSPTPTMSNGGNSLSGVACPLVSQCTAIGGGGQVTFNPTSPGTPTPTTIDSGNSLRGVACPLVSQCTAVDNVGRQVTFNPTSPGTPTPTTIATAPPVNLGLGRRAKAISAGQNHTCVVLDDGNVRCWGDGGTGQLGYANTSTVGDNETPDTAGPVSLGAGRTARAISAGGSYTCAVLNDGSVRCWGLGASGRLGYANQDNIGDNETPASAGPVNIGAGRSAVALSAGGRHTCARLDDGSVRCWGSGANGRLGYCNQTSIGDDETPATAGPVNLAPGDGGVGCAATAGGSPTVSSTPQSNAKNAPVVDANAARARGLRSCLAAVAAHASRERRLARRGSARRRARARRHLNRHARDGRRGCLRLYGRTPGRITGLRASTRGRTQIELSFNAPGTDGSHPPPAGSYVIKQSLRRIRGARDFSRARTLCKGICRFRVSGVGVKVSLAVTDLRPRTTYYYAVVARDNVSARRGPRSQTVNARTR